MDFSGIWDKEKYDKFINYLINLGEEEYKRFNSKIVFTNYKMLGIRLPILRRIAKEIVKGDYKAFLKLSNNTYYEEVMLYLLVLASCKEIKELMVYFYQALNLIDNWALCDSFCGSLKIVNKNKEFFLEVIDQLVKNNNIYYVRVGLVLLLNYYVREEYLDLIFTYLNNIKSTEYYVNMAKAWLICEIFIKYQSQGLRYLQNNRLDDFTINKAISKIRDSYRVSKEMKKEVLIYRKL